GLPMIEGMRAGVPICVADRPYAREICQDAALYFDPRQPADVANSLGRVLDDSELRECLIRRGKERVVQLDLLGGYAKLMSTLMEAAIRGRCA
ncbi:MAG: glycosyltransferase, partial [Coriobacteriia bacterium]|nr:glycosyltransferase [Coriobacteriia bacterium]